MEKKDRSSKGISQTAQQRIVRAATAYAETGSLITTSEMCGQSYGTIQAYQKLGLFQEIFDKVRKEKFSEIQARLSRIVDLASLALADRIENGDEYVTKDGSIGRKSMSGKDLAIVMGITIQRGMEMSGTAPSQGNSADKLAELATKLERLALLQSGKTIEPVDKIVDKDALLRTTDVMSNDID